MAEYRLAPKAEKDLEDMWSYSCDGGGEQRANDYTDGLVGAFDALAMSPAAAPACDDTEPGYRRQVLQSHVLYFRITRYGIEIIRGLHGRMQAASQLKFIGRWIYLERPPKMKKPTNKFVGFFI